MSKKDSFTGMKYRELFPNDKEKAIAFDKIAEKFYFSNFGTTSKSDVETLMFSIYIEQILDKCPDKADFNAYSDYTLSKLLGITQQRISNLKVKKELLYPYKDFDWKSSFLKISEHAFYNNGKIILYVPDKNLYLEIKNAIEIQDGFVETQLTSNLLKVSVPYFLDLLLALEPDKTREDIKKELKNKIEEHNSDIKFLNSRPLGEELRKQTIPIIIDLFGECIPIFGGITRSIATNIYKACKRSKGED